MGFSDRTYHERLPSLLIDSDSVEARCYTRRRVCVLIEELEPKTNLVFLRLHDICVL